MTDAKHSFDVRGCELGVTVVRSPIYAHHDPRVPADDELFSFQDQGIHRFVCRLVPHAGSRFDIDTVRLATELDQPPTVLVESAHSGSLPLHDSFLRIDAANVVLSALKDAEDGDALVIRCHESLGLATRATIELPRWKRRIEASFGPWELKTFRVPDAAHEAVAEIDLLEREVAT
jgi:alpha-mannosidase